MSNSCTVCNWIYVYKYYTTKKKEISNSEVDFEHMNTPYLIAAAGVSGQSDAEREDPDTLDGKCIKGKNKNKNNELPQAGEGPRLRTSNKKQGKGIIYLQCIVG